MIEDMKLILEWAKFDSHIIPPSASDRQRREMRGAYFAGAAAVLLILRELSYDQKVCEPILSVLNSLDHEIHEFVPPVSEPENSWRHRLTGILNLEPDSYGAARGPKVNF